MSTKTQRQLLECGAHEIAHVSVRYDALAVHHVNLGNLQALLRLPSPHRENAKAPRDNARPTYRCGRRSRARTARFAALALRTAGTAAAPQTGGPRACSRLCEPRAARQIPRAVPASAARHPTSMNDSTAYRSPCAGWKCCASAMEPTIIRFTPCPYPLSQPLLRTSVERPAFC